MRCSLSAVTVVILIAFVTSPVALADEVKPTEAAAATDDATQTRARELIYVLRQYRPFDRGDEWAGAIRELTKIGQPALPELLLELKQTERGRTLRAVLFTLRAIGDPRAVPFVIEALPKAERLSNDGSDYGLRCVDPELHQFMRRNQNYSARGEEESFGYGRAINEILGTLHKLTQTAEPDLEKGPEPSWKAAYWREWWKAKVKAGSAPSKDKSLELANRKEDLVERDGVRKFGPLFSTGPAQFLSPVAEVVLEREALGDAPSQFDFETGRTYEYREGIRLGKGDHSWRDSVDCDIRNGIDLDAQEGHDLHVWLIENHRWDALDAEVRSGQPFDHGHEAYANWMLGRKLTKDEIGTYLFVTREGSRGVLRVHRTPEDARPKFEYRLWNRKSNAVIARRAEATGELGEWQPSKTVILKEPGFGNHCLFRFDRGEREELPASIFSPAPAPQIESLLTEKGAVLNDEQIAKWARGRGVDMASQRSRVIAEGGPAGPRQPAEEMDLTLLDARFVQVTPAAFENLSRAHAKEILARYSDFYPLNFLQPASDGDDAQATYLFETKSGFVGLISILHVRPDLSSIAFQLKLAKQKSIPGQTAQ